RGPFEIAGVAFRLPTAGDLVAVSGAGSPAEARRALLARCVLDGGELSDALAEAVADRMAAADPQAAARVALRCPACAHEWAAPAPAPLELDEEVPALPAPVAPRAAPPSPPAASDQPEQPRAAPVPRLEPVQRNETEPPRAPRPVATREPPVEAPARVALPSA